MEIGTVQQIDINEEMQGAYLDYAMSVIVSRALPDVRDGLKPVHRRILYAMHDMGLGPDRPYKKSARIVGEVLGKYHPHSDAAVYEAMARMAQDFSLRYVLVDGQGNFGSVDGDSPAAMRYTEARLAPVSQEMLADIDKETVDFVPNFDETLAEPAVLPSALPNLLVNGASGIAVGMTTNIPPHNLGEVCDALVHLIDHYEELDDVTVEDLTHFVRGPDFPTGGVVYRYADEDGDRADLIRNAYALGRGRFTVQAHVHIEELSRNRSRIVVTELPYQVNKTRLIERIAELVRDGKLEGITDLRDESDRQGMRICIELTRTVEARDVLSQLFRLTPMQQTFSLAMLALVDGEPRLLPLKRVLTHYLEHRQEIVTRRSHYLLDRARQRAHILEGLLTALDRMDQVIDTIRRSRTTDTARDNLVKDFSLSELQAQAILDMPLKRLAALERQKTSDEYKEKLEEIRHLEGLLQSPTQIRALIRQDLLELKGRYGDARRTRIVELERGHHTARDLLREEDVLLTLWRDGRVSRATGAPLGPPAAAPLVQLWGNTRDDLAFFMASGQAFVLPLHQVPEGQGAAVGSLADMDSSEAPTSALILPHPLGDEELPDTYLTLVTRLGRIKRITLKDFSVVSRGAVAAINLDEGDRLIWAAQTDGEVEILLVTRQGKAIRFSEKEVRPMGLSAAGVMAVKLGNNDAVVGMGVVRGDAFVVTVSEKGYAKRTAVGDFPLQKRYGGGVQAAKLSAKTGPLAVAVLAAESDTVVLAAADGQATALPVQAIHAMGRAVLGQKSRQDTGEPYADLVRHGPACWLAVLAGPCTGADPARAEAEPDPGGVYSPKAKPATGPTQLPLGLPGTSEEVPSPRRTAVGGAKRGKTTYRAVGQAGQPIGSAPGESRTRKKKQVRSVPKT